MPVAPTLPPNLSVEAALRPYLIDVSRLVWRAWAGRLPTGIDRVCLAYLHHYGARANAVVQRGGRFWVFSAAGSDRLFKVLRAGRSVGRARLLLAIAAGLLSAKRDTAQAGSFYFNVGHTGLDEQALPLWVASTGVRAIYFVHDLIPLTHPQYCRPGEAAKHARRMANVLASAHGVIGNSQATIDSLAHFAADRRAPMPRAIAAWISGTPLRRVSTPPLLTTPYFVVLGTIEGRKNHALLLDIWRDWVGKEGERAPTLVLVGQRGWQAEHVLTQLDQPAAFAGKVIELNYCSDLELACWIHGARALLMPSFAEGFGLPIIEALQQGTPVIASDLPVFREIGGGIPLLIDPADRAQWTVWIKNFLNDDPERNRQIARMAEFRAAAWPAHFLAVDAWLAKL